MNKIKLTIVICAFNEQKFIKENIKKLSHQVGDKKKVEIVIIDNDSVDKTYEIAKKYIEENSIKNIRLFSIEHCHLTGSRNFGLKVSNGEFISFIDADGFVFDNWFSTLDFNISKDFDVFCGSVAIDPKSSYFSKGIFYSHFLPSLESAGANKIIGANMSFKKDKLEELGGFYTVPSGRGDETLVLDLLKQKFKDLNVVTDISNKVINTYPDKLTLWLFQQFEEGRSDRVSSKFLRHKYKNFIKFLIKLSTPLTIIIISMILIFDTYFTFISYFIFTLFLIRHIARWKYYSYSLFFGFKKFGLNHLFFIPIVIIGSIFLDLGYLLGGFGESKKSNILSKPGKVLRKFEK